MASVLSETGDTDDSAFAEINARFQSAVLSSMDRQLEVLEDELNIKAVDLKRADQKNKDVGESLANVLHESKRLQAALTKARGDLEKEIGKNLSTTGERDMLLKQLNTKSEDYDAASKELEETKHQLHASITEVKSLQSAALVFKRNLHIRTSLEDSLRTDLNLKDEEIKSLKEENSKLQTKNDKLHSGCQEVQKKVVDQKDSSQVVQRELEKVVENLHLANATKTVLLGKWNEALKAMGERDRAMKNMESSMEAAKSEAKTQSNLAVYAEQQAAESVRRSEQAAERLSVAERERDSALDTAGRLHRNVKTFSDEMAELNKQVSLQTSELTRLRVTTSAVQEKEARTREQLQSTQNALNAMKHSLSSMEAEAQERVRRAEKLLENNEGESVRQAREDERALVDRSNKEQLLKNRLQEAETSVTVLAEQNLSLVALYKEMVRQFNFLSNEAAFVRDEVLRKEHLLNKAKAEVTQMRDGMAVSAASTARGNAKASQEADAAARQLGVLQSDYTRTREELLLACRREEGLKADLRAAADEREAVEALLQRLRSDLKGAERAKLQRTMEVDTVRVTLREKTKQINELEAINTNIQRQLTDATAMRDIRKEEYLAATAQLRQRINLLSEELTSTREARAKTEVAYAKLDVRLLQAERASAGLRKELKSQQENAFKLRVKMQGMEKERRDTERKFSEYSNHAERLLANRRDKRTDRVIRGQSARKPRVGRILRPTAGDDDVAGSSSFSASAPFSSASTASSSLSPGTGGSSRFPDIDSSLSYASAGRGGAMLAMEQEVGSLTQQLNRAKTVAAERLHEIMQLRQKVEQMITHEAAAHRRASDATAPGSASRSLGAERMALVKRCQRIEKLVCSLDSQLRLAAPEVLIRYDLASTAHLPISRDIQRILGTPLQIRNVGGETGAGVVIEGLVVEPEIPAGDQVEHNGEGVHKNGSKRMSPRKPTQDSGRRTHRRRGKSNDTRGEEFQGGGGNNVSSQAASEADDSDELRRAEAVAVSGSPANNA